MKFFVATIGCFKNTVDSELLIRELERDFTFAHESRDADVIIVNTCSFIERAKQESINAILLYSKQGGKKIIVAGCLGQQYGRELLEEMPEVDGVLGVYAHREIRDVCERVMSGERLVRVRKEPYPDSGSHMRKRLLTASHYAFVKISDGCNRKCSFCLIPSLKGKLRSRSMASIVEEAHALARQGVKEISIVSQESTSYGIDRYEKKMLAKLLLKIAAVKGIRWIRLLYNYPGEIGEELLRCITSEEKLCNYLDIPIQHISDRILRGMKREISGKRIRDSLAMIKERYPEICLRTTLLVGFPGETAVEFSELLKFVKEIAFDRLGVFSYSREFGTESFKMRSQIPDEVKEARVSEIMEAQAEISLKKNRSFIGKTLPVIVDAEIENGLLDARSEYDAPEIDHGVLVRGGGELVGKMIQVRITDAVEYDLIGRVMRQRSP